MGGSWIMQFQMREVSGMKRSAGITVIGILSILGSAFVFLIGIFAALIPFLAPVSSTPELSGSPAFFKAMFVGIALFFMLLAVWGIITSIGLFRTRGWARISILIFSVLLILQGIFAVLMSLVMPIPPVPEQAADPAVLASVRIFMACFALALLGLGIWWLVFFNRQKVKERFASTTAALLAPSESPTFSPTHGLPAVTSLPSSAGRPLSFTILAWLMLVGCLFMPLNIFMKAPAVLFTAILTGWYAVGYYIAFLVVQLYIGIGLLHLRFTARLVAIDYFCFVFINTAVFYLVPGAHARMLDLIRRSWAMFPWVQPWQNQQLFLLDATPLMMMGSFVGLVTLLIPLYFLITRKAAFEKAATARRAQG
jgi:hypothetical protein